MPQTLTNNPKTESNRPAAQALEMSGQRLADAGSQMDHLTQLGESVAECLLAGGSLEAARVAKYWPSEVGGRAGGFMGLRRGNTRDPESPPSKHDVALFGLPQPQDWDADTTQRLEDLVDSPLHLVGIGREDQRQGIGDADRFLGFTGAAEPSEGLGQWQHIEPLTPMRLLDQIVRTWALHGEIVTACTRGGRMPTIYMSVWLENGPLRNMAMHEHNNRREPWRANLFHSDYYVPPLEAGYAGGEFLRLAEELRQTLLGQQDSLRQAGQWMAQAKRAGRSPHAVATGHSYPTILGLDRRKPDPEAYPIRWGAPISNIRRSVPEDLGEGDVAMHFGYAPVEVDAVGEVLDRGIRFIYSSPYGRPAELEDHPNLLWLDLPWRIGDAAVDIPGYSCRISPISSTTHTMAYFAILSEFAAEMGWL